jgi:hypothetical protein
VYSSLAIKIIHKFQVYQHSRGDVNFLIWVFRGVGLYQKESGGRRLIVYKRRGINFAISGV